MEVCPRCQKTFSSVSTLNRHVRNIHGEKNKFETSKLICPSEDCIQQFNRYHGLRDTLKKVHGVNNLSEELFLIQKKARENPEPVFDLSECNLKIVPSGVYSLCKVFRKEKLLLQMNQLSSLSGGGNLSDLHLLTHLDLHQNNLTVLSEDIINLTNLKVLNVSFNQLKKLPEAMGCLVQLKTLDCSHNKLGSLPSSLGQLKFLTTLDVQANPNLSFLPPFLLSIEQLLVDQGIRHYLSRGETATDIPSPSGQYNGLRRTERNDHTEPTLSREVTSAAQEGHRVQACISMTRQHALQLDSFTLLEKKKEEKQKELLDIERSLFTQKNEEFKRHESMKQGKDKLILDLREQQRKLEKDVSRVQSQKEEERSKLMNYLLKVERQSDERIEDLISLSQALRQSSHWQDQDVRERELQEEYKRRSHRLRHQEVIDAMEFLLAEECARKAKLIEYEKNKSEVIQNSLLREVEWREQVGWLLGVRDAHQSAVVAAVETDSEVQKALVATLLERSDLRSRGLVLQVALIQQQLAVLTDVELQRKKVDSVQHLNDLAEKRKALSELLLELLREQQERRKELTNQLQELEIDRQLSGSSTEYWLQQYQRLLDVRPPQLRASLDPELVHELVTAGAAHCLPFLSFCDIHSLTPIHLAQIGVTSVEDQAAVMEAVSAYMKHKQAQVEPSAPPVSPDHLPSAPAPPTEPSPECVVCMEAKCDVVFVPCGHLCTCSSCASHLLLCPLCRGSLQRKIHIFI